jgi:two-component system, OmpR family, sensor histidine kinase KdpD
MKAAPGHQENVNAPSSGASLLCAGLLYDREMSIGFKRIAWWGYLAAVALVAAATAIGVAARGHLAGPDVVMLYLLVIVVAAGKFGRGAALAASALSVLAYDLFFVLPFHTLAVADERHLLTFATMFVVGLLISALTLRIRRHEREALERETRTAALYSFSTDLAGAVDAQQVATVIARHAEQTFGGGMIVLGPGPEDGRELQFGNTPACGDTVEVALKGGGETLGVLRLEQAEAATGSAERRQLLHGFTAQATLALERARLAEAARAAELRAKTEEMRSSLLSAVSHDLRTPLGAITGAATTLRDAGAAIDAEQRAELVEAICEEAERLERFVVNLLEMTRLEAGELEVKREWVPLEELVGSALTRLETQLEGRPIQTDIPADLPLVSVDPVLAEQVFFNLLDNAAKHTAPGTAVEISARAEGSRVQIQIADRGSGLRSGDEGLVFQKFFRRAEGGVRGAGLGLAICRGIVEAHGGTICAENREGGGAAFQVSLPLPGTAPLVPAEFADLAEERGAP